MGVLRKFFPYLLLLPGMMILIALIYYPFLRNISYSLTDYKLTNPQYSYVGLANYLDAIKGSDFQMALKTTFIWVVINVLFMILLGVMGALVMNSQQIRGSFILEIVLLIPWVLPEAVTGYIWKLLLNYKSGILYNLLSVLRIIPDKYDIFANTLPALFACVAANVWRAFPLIALTSLAKLRTLPQERIEAAVIDGASRKDLFLFIELPYIQRVLQSVGLLCFIWTFNAYGIISVMTNGGPAKGTQVVSVLIQKAAFQYYNFSQASTYAVLILCVLVSVVILLNLFFQLVTKSSED